MEQIIVCILLAFCMVVPIMGAITKTIDDVIENPVDYDITK